MHDVSLIDATAGSNNSAHAVLFEAVNYVIHMESNKELISAAVNVLGQRMSATNQSNYRYLALDAMQVLRMHALPPHVLLIAAHPCRLQCLCQPCCARSCRRRIGDKVYI